MPRGSGTVGDLHGRGLLGDADRGAEAAPENEALSPLSPAFNATIDSTPSYSPQSRKPGEALPAKTGVSLKLG
jgi:hypothetical protein